MSSDHLLASQLVSEQTLNQIMTLTQQIHQQLELGDILDVTVKGIREILGCDRAVVYRFLPDGDGVVAEESASPEWTPILGQLIYDPCFQAKWVDLYRQGQISLIEDVETKPLEPCYKKLLQRLQIRANLVVPILLPQYPSPQTSSDFPNLWGLLIVHQCQSSRQWKTLEIQFLQQMAMQLGIAIEYREADQHLRQLYQKKPQGILLPIPEITGRMAMLVEGITEVTNQNSPETLYLHTEQELRWKEALLRSMTDASNLAFFVVDNRTDNILYFNHRFCEIWGIEHLESQMLEGVLKNNDIIPDCLPLIADVTAFAESCKPLQFEENRAIIEDEIAFSDGRTIRRFSSQIRDQSDRYFGRLYIFEDISDRQQVEINLKESEERYRSVIAAMGEGVVLQQADGQITACNQSAERILGLSFDQMRGRTSIDPYWRAIQHDGSDFPGENHPAMVTLSTGKPQFDVIMGVHKPDGNLTWISINSQPLFHPDQPQPYAVVTSFSDITVRKQAEETLKQQAERERMIYGITQRIRQSLDLDEILQTTVAEVREFLQTDRVIIYRFNPDWSGVVVKESVGSGWKSILNLEITDSYFVENQGKSYQQNTIKMTPDIYTGDLSLCHLELLEKLQVRAKLVVPILQNQGLWGLLVAHHCSEPREWHPLESELLKQLAIQLAIAIHQSELHQQLQLANQELQNLAMVDQLTQIANRRCFDEILNQEWYRLIREQRPLSLLLCDIDYFKQYNDTYGHSQGDICLQQVAQALQQAVQHSIDLVARYGGEEFVVILPHTDQEGALQVADKIQEVIQQFNLPHRASKVAERVTMSIGIGTIIPTLERVPLDLINAADEALYQAKTQGRNRVVSSLL